MTESPKLIPHFYERIFMLSLMENTCERVYFLFEQDYSLDKRRKEGYTNRTPTPPWG